MADEKSEIMDSETERNLNAECLALEMAGQTWHVPFDTLQAIPRVGETIRLAGGSAGKVAEVEYEFAPEGGTNQIGEGDDCRCVIRGPSPNCNQTVVMGFSRMQQSLTIRSHMHTRAIVKRYCQVHARRCGIFEG